MSPFFPPACRVIAPFLCSSVIWGREAFRRPGISGAGISGVFVFDVVYNKDFSPPPPPPPPRPFPPLEGVSVSPALVFGSVYRFRMAIFPGVKSYGFLVFNWILRVVLGALSYFLSSLLFARVPFDLVPLR